LKYIRQGLKDILTLLSARRWYQTERPDVGIGHSCPTPLNLFLISTGRLLRRLVRPVQVKSVRQECPTHTRPSIQPTGF